MPSSRLYRRWIASACSYLIFRFHLKIAALPDPMVSAFGFHPLSHGFYRASLELYGLADDFYGIS